MDRYQEIYAGAADDYDRLVRAEDVDGNLGAVLAAFINSGRVRVAEVGAGTGRLTRILRSIGAEVWATEPSAAMIKVAERNLGLQITQASADALPMPDGHADIALAGWVFGHFASWYPEEWRDRVRVAIGEMMRVTRRDGRLLVLETLGTAQQEPAPPTERLAAYFQLLESEFGFVRTVLSTDFQFATPEEAVRVIGSFFGDAIAERVHRERWTRVPEWTGLWSMRCS